MVSLSYKIRMQNKMFVAALVACFFITACSNSEFMNAATSDDQFVPPEKHNEITNAIAPDDQFASLQKQEYIPLDDSEYQYAGLPRIVIETENHKKIGNTETEIPAKLQIWGGRAPESDVMTLTIRGRGNDTWRYPKKPYAIKFENKVSLLGMPSAKKWVMLANYRDRTLMRNAVAFELARKTSLVWTPEGRFAEVFLNGQYLGCYYICDKIEVKKNRLELGDEGYLLEFDSHYDEEFKFKTTYNDLPVNIKYPKNIDNVSFNYIVNYVDTTEILLKQDENSIDYQDYIDQDSFADFFLVLAISNNAEAHHPKSVFMHKRSQDKLTAGPVWDFDYATFNINKVGFTNTKAAVFKDLFQKRAFKDALINHWNLNKAGFEDVVGYIDSLADYISIAGQRNAALWPIYIENHAVGDEEKKFEEAAAMLKECLQRKIEEIDSLIILLKK